MYPSPPRCRNHPFHEEANTGCGTPSGNGLRCGSKGQMGGWTEGHPPDLRLGPIQFNASLGTSARGG